MENDSVERQVTIQIDYSQLDNLVDKASHVLSRGRVLEFYLDIGHNDASISENDKEVELMKIVNLVTALTVGAALPDKLFSVPDFKFKEIDVEAYGYPKDAEMVRIILVEMCRELIMRLIGSGALDISSSAHQYSIKIGARYEFMEDGEVLLVPFWIIEKIQLMGTTMDNYPTISKKQMLIKNKQYTKTLIAQLLGEK